ncbi:histone methyltransferase set1 [Ceratobasidium sp. 395]|nr:histone methyltransferase set1 [Ceratobasidium sp. 395]
MFPGADRIDLCLQVTNGLLYLHGNGVVFGDLKAQNILVDYGGTAKITDFGLSVLRDSSILFSSTGNPGGGTARWMAPELFEEFSTRSSEGDMYALAMTFIARISNLLPEILTDQFPFPHLNNDTQVILAVVYRNAMPNRPERLEATSEQDEELWSLLLQCWNRQPKMRPNATTIAQKLCGQEHICVHLREAQVIYQRKSTRPKPKDLPPENQDEPVVIPARSLFSIPTPPTGLNLSLPDSVGVLDPYAQKLVDDEEDLYYIRLLLGKGRGVELPSSVAERPTEEDTSNYPPGLRKHITGSARTEGCYKIPEAFKPLYLPRRNRAIVDVSATAVLAAAFSRFNRANSRLGQSLEQHEGQATDAGDVLKFNRLRIRKKQLVFSPSPIHNWGLYAAEAIPAGDMVIEYVGEVIKQRVADKREKYYEKTGIGSSYLFRLDHSLVVDATKKGNLGRLINHCCTPNCTARIITINGKKKIVIYAKTNINVGDEITYDRLSSLTRGPEDPVSLRFSSVSRLPQLDGLVIFPTLYSLSFPLAHTVVFTLRMFLVSRM